MGDRFRGERDKCGRITNAIHFVRPAAKYIQGERALNMNDNLEWCWMSKRHAPNKNALLEFSAPREWARNRFKPSLCYILAAHTSMQAEILLQRWTNLMSIVSKIVNFGYARSPLQPQRAATFMFVLGFKASHTLSCRMNCWAIQSRNACIENGGNHSHIFKFFNLISNEYCVGSFQIICLRSPFFEWKMQKHPRK